MPSANYEILFRAIQGKKPIRFIGKNRPREACPHVLGWTNSRETLFAFQTGGQSSNKLPGWRCFAVAEIKKIEELDSPWRSGTSHTQRHSCVKDVDIDVNPHAEQRYVWPEGNRLD